MLWNERWPHSLAEGWNLVHLSLVFFILRSLLDYIRLDRLLRWLHSPVRLFPHNPERLVLIQRYLQALLWRFRTNPNGDCLIRSLVLFYFSRRCGFPVHFYCGVCQGGDALDGHAWLSLDGEPFLEKGNPFTRYTVTYLFPDRRTEVSASAKAEDFTRKGASQPNESLQRAVEIE